MGIAVSQLTEKIIVEGERGSLIVGEGSLNVGGEGERGSLIVGEGVTECGRGGVTCVHMYGVACCCML